ncbi:hypothetical protein FB451DRAFT_1491041 [Mycena latifolia]|nr:hypothetical protein FB451DRAFT_1491041 [Mycena latifolia]
MSNGRQQMYIDLLIAASGNYPHWDPEIRVRPGDYGRMERRKCFLARKNSVFVIEGNIYDNGTAKKYGIPDPGQYGGDSSNGSRWIVSDNGTHKELSGSASGIPAAIAQCAVKGALEFSAGKNAFLVMHNEMTTSIDSPGALRAVLNDPKMRGTVVVSEVHCCSAYIRGLIGKAGGSFALGLSVEHPVAGIASANAKAEWVHTATSGDIKSAANSKGERKYYPLFSLVSLEDTDFATALPAIEEL